LVNGKLTSRGRFLFLLLLAWGLWGCNGETWEYAKTPVPNATQRAEKPLVIVVGDSIAAGWQVCSPQPCTGVELDWWQTAIGEHAWVLNRGVGNSTTQDLLDRWERDTANADIIIMLIGINDAFRGKSDGEILANLETLYQRATKAGALPIVATLLPFDESQNPAAYAVMQAVNTELRARPDWLILDLNTALPDPPPAHEMATLLHPNAAGYARLGGYVRDWWAAQNALLNDR